MAATTADLIKAGTKAAANQQAAQKHAQATAAQIAAATGHGAQAPAAPPAPTAAR